MVHAQRATRQNQPVAAPAPHSATTFRGTNAPPTFDRTGGSADAVTALSLNSTRSAAVCRGVNHRVRVLRLRLARLALLAVVFGCAGPRSSAEMPPRAPNAARSLFDRSWLDEHERSVNLRTWSGSPLLLTMVFRSCRSRCPMTIHKLKRVASEFRKRGRSANFVLVTLDPLQDTPSRLATFKREQELDPASFHLLSGGREQTRELARFLSVHAAYDDFHIDHDVRIAVFDERGALVRNLEGWNFPDDEPVMATR